MKRRALLLNWRDPWHPRAGGAELVTLRVAERLVAGGWSVEWFSGAYPGSAPQEDRAGIRFVRKGSAATVHVEALRRYSGAEQNRFDVAVDQVNTIPFFTPLYLRIPKIAFFHQLAREIWFYESRFPMSAAGYVAEPLYLLPYRHVPVATVSRSSALSLKNIGLAGPMHIIPEATDEVPEPFVPKKTQPAAIAVVGRVTPSKRIEFAIEAAGLLRARGWEGTLYVAGGGDERYVASLRRRAAPLGNHVKFLGRVSDAERTELLRGASLLWMTSVREGWGLVVTEAAAHGTPAVVFDVPGLRDSVRHEVTGLVVERNAEALARGSQIVLNDLETFAQAALADSRTYDWEKTAAAFERILLQYASH